ncbi:peflin-like [Scaptodrosophila lebanonensis]|uniref:Peflin-like n=1 Tax=Drosophila lebanonensis TaxID=7225 RepID=A0A6J2U9M8_DROLE|nr:peflin-like [Scaptodrosophila lebanonensis]
MSYGSPGYNPYGQEGEAFPPQNAQVSPQAQQWFAMVDQDGSGEINASELQAALINGRGEHFSENACKLMISMFDKDASGTIDIFEFEKLFNYINEWVQLFKTYDQDSSGHIEEAQAFTQMGFRLTPNFIQFLVKKSDPQNHKEISVDQFIVLCIQMQRFTEAFRQRDTQQNGTITIGFEDFLTVAIGCFY